MYAEALHHAGYQVIDCADGRVALGVALRVAVSAVITEVGAEGEGCGWTLIDRLRRVPATASMPIIALVSRDVANDRARAIELGVARCFTVPLAPADLVRAVAEVSYDPRHGAADDSLTQ
jgi:DNA-binding response OmpR family regulator